MSVDLNPNLKKLLDITPKPGVEGGESVLPIKTSNNVVFIPQGSSIILEFTVGTVNRVYLNAIVNSDKSTITTNIYRYKKKISGIVTKELISSRRIPKTLIPNYTGGPIYESRTQQRILKPINQSADFDESSQIYEFIIENNIPITDSETTLQALYQAGYIFNPSPPENCIVS